MAMIDINWKPGRKDLRTFGLIAFVAFAVVGAGFYWKGGPFLNLEPETDAAVAKVLWVLSPVCGLLALVAPAVLLPLYVTLMAISLPIGWVISHVLMGAMFYLVLTPIGLVFRLMGRDPMHRKLDRNAGTYWIRRPEHIDPKRYYRQY